MKKILGKIRDILYDSVDYLIIIAIIVGVTLIIYWRIGGLFAQDSFEKAPGNTEEIADDIPDDSDESNNSDEVDDPGEVDEKDDAEQDDTEDLVHFVIDSGATLSQIAEDLAKKDLIKSEKKFIDKTNELKFDTKLKYGEFDIPKGSSSEEILKILTK